jgi:hypothetical protein
VTRVSTLYDYPDVPVGAGGLSFRLVVATHPKGSKKQRIGVERDGLIYELFVTKLPQEAFTASDVVALYLHRGSFETVLWDEDREQDPDRWCSHAACGQEAQAGSSRNGRGNLRLELGHQLEPEPLRTTEFAPAVSSAKEQKASACGYAPAEVALPFKQGRFSGHDFVLQPDGSLRCPAGQALHATEERFEADGSLRLVYAARISHCRTCQLRERCQWHGGHTQKPRRVSVLLHPLHIGSTSLQWHSFAAGSIVEPVDSSCGTSGLMYTWSHPSILTLLRLHRSFLVHSVLITGSRGKSASHAIRLPQRLVSARSHSSGCQNALRQRFGLLTA